MSIYDASSSWSGYQYQGKITIYIALKLLNSINIDESGKYYIEIEHREDLAIKNECEYLSFHQVKARKNDINMSNYLEAIDKLYEEKKRNPKADIFLHTIVDIKDWGEEKYKSLYENRIKKNKEDIIQLENEKKKFKDLKDIKKIENKILEFKNEINDNQIKYKESHKIKSIQIYKYGSKEFCGLGEIKGYIFEQIEKYLLNTNQENKMDDIEIIYNALICFMDDYIKKRHANTVKKYFPLKDIKNLLDNGDLLERGRLFHLSIIKDIYCSIDIDNFCSSLCEKREKCNMSSCVCKISKIIDYLLGIDLSDFERIITKLNPHVLVKDWEHDGRNFLDRKGLNFFYDTIINEIDNEVSIFKRSIKYDKNGISYLPTTIPVVSRKFKNSEIENYKKFINDNDFLLEELFEDNSFITENLNSGNLLEYINDVDEIDFDIAKDEDNKKDKGYLVNTIRFIDIESVKEDLNND